MIIKNKKIRKQLSKNFKAACNRLKKDGYTFSHIAESIGMKPEYLFVIRSGSKPVGYKHLRMALSLNEFKEEELMRGLNEQELDFVIKKLSLAGSE